MSAKRPILCSFDLSSELVNIITDQKCGFCVPPDDIDKLKEKIVYSYEHQDEIKKYGENGRLFIENSLCRKKSTKKYAEIIMKTFESAHVKKIFH